MKFFIPIKIVLVFLLLANWVFAQARFPARGFSLLLNDAQAEEILNSFSNNLYRKDRSLLHNECFIYRFEFAHFSKERVSQVHLGILSGPSILSSKIRLDLLSDSRSIDPYKSFLLSRDTNNSKVWQKELGSSIKLLSEKEIFESWIPGVNHTPFDFLMPFISWPNSYEKSGRVCGRNAHLFKFTPPVNLGLSSNLKSVRIAIDDTYHAPLRIEHMDGGVLPRRTFSLQSFKKIENHWIIKAIDLKDRDSRSRTRFEVKSVAHNLELSQKFFTKEGLAKFFNLENINFQDI